MYVWFGVTSALRLRGQPRSAEGYRVPRQLREDSAATERYCWWSGFIMGSCHLTAALSQARSRPKTRRKTHASRMRCAQDNLTSRQNKCPTDRADCKNGKDNLPCFFLPGTDSSTGVRKQMMKRGLIRVSTFSSARTSDTDCHAGVSPLIWVKGLCKNRCVFGLCAYVLKCSCICRNSPEEALSWWSSSGC